MKLSAMPPAPPTPPPSPSSSSPTSFTSLVSQPPCLQRQHHTHLPHVVLPPNRSLLLVSGCLPAPLVAKSALTEAGRQLAHQHLQLHHVQRLHFVRTFISFDHSLSQKKNQRKPVVVVDVSKDLQVRRKFPNLAAINWKYQPDIARKFLLHEVLYMTICKSKHSYSIQGSVSPV